MERGTKKHPPNSRSSLISGRSINLQENDPLDRLKELCKQGKYNYKINWDRFQNGFMCECVIYYSLRRKTTKVLKKEVYWVETDDLLKAQKTVVAILLENLGLGVSEPEQEDEAKLIGQELLRVGAKTLSGLMSGMEKKSWAEIAEED